MVSAHGGPASSAVVERTLDAMPPLLGQYVQRCIAIRPMLPTWAFTLERMTGIEPALSAWESERFYQ